MPAAGPGPAFSASPPCRRSAPERTSSQDPTALPEEAAGLPRPPPGPLRRPLLRLLRRGGRGQAEGAGAGRGLWMLEGASSRVPPLSWHVCGGTPRRMQPPHLSLPRNSRAAPPRECFTRRVKTGGEGGARGAEIWGNARSPGWNASQVTPDAVPSAPPSPRGAPHSPPLSTLLRQHSRQLRRSFAQNSELTPPWRGGLGGGAPDGGGAGGPAARGARRRPGPAARRPDPRHRLPPPRCVSQSASLPGWGGGAGRCPGGACPTPTPFAVAAPAGEVKAGAPAAQGGGGRPEAVPFGEVAAGSATPGCRGSGGTPCTTPCRASRCRGRGDVQPRTAPWP